MEYKTRNDDENSDSQGTMEDMKFDHTTKWYMHKQESAPKNVVHKILSDFEIQPDHLIPHRRPDQEMITKKKWLVVMWILLFRRTREWK